MLGDKRERERVGGMMEPRHALLLFRLRKKRMIDIRIGMVSLSAPNFVHHKTTPRSLFLLKQMKQDPISLPKKNHIQGHHGRSYQDIVAPF
jgi:hypothetical protein